MSTAQKELDPLRRRPRGEDRRDSWRDELERGIAAALGWIKSRQHEKGYWSGRLETNACMEAEWLLAFHFLGHEHPGIDRLLKSLADRQRADGSWEVYYGADTGDINTTVECYAALRVYGYDPDSPVLSRARAWILANGGLGEVRVFTRYWLALLGEWPWERTPNVPPEIIRLPRWCSFNIYHFACWARATMVPIAVLAARRPTRPPPPGRRMDELFPGGRDRFDYTRRRLPDRSVGHRFFELVDRALHALQAMGWIPGRETAIRRCLDWIIRHQDSDGSWGGIQPPWIYSVMALCNEGYPLTHPVLRKALGALDGDWSYEKNGALYIQACQSPVWDTLLACLALQDCGCGRDDPAYLGALDWVLDKQVLETGDWSVKAPDLAPGGWAFEHANRWYPDMDDTGVALMVLGRARAADAGDPDRLEAATERGRRWLKGMQSRGSGWGAFDRDNDNILLTRLPFADFGEMLDPPNVDVTAHVLEGLASCGVDPASACIRRAVAFLEAEQERDGSWFGRWGVNHIYGTSAVLSAFAALGEDMQAASVQRAARWLASRQNGDGGWGESCASYVDAARRGRGPSTPSQTAWAVMGLLAAGPDRYQAPIDAALVYLLTRQRTDGTWDEPQYTGTGFPGYGVGARVDPGDRGLVQGRELSRGFMINYNLYRHYFPMMALGRARRTMGARAAH